MSLPFDISNLNSVLGAYFRENSGDIFLDAIYKPEDSDKTNVFSRKILELDSSRMKCSN